MSRGADGDPVTREHVEKFLKWYEARCSGTLPRNYADVWFNALHTLNLGELRNGMRFVTTLSRVPVFHPQDFWHLCKNRRSEAMDRRFAELREMLKTKEKTC